nr:hypothetical protein [Tessaracoccus coleopterorum]
MSLHDAVNDVMPSVLTDLKRLISIRSISSQPEHADDVLAAADLVVELLKGAGCPEVTLLEAGGATPPSSATSRHPRVSRPCCSTPTTTCSPRVTRTVDLTRVRLRCPRRADVGARIGR